MLRARRLAPCPAVPSIMPTGLTSSLPFHSGSFQKSTDFRRPTASIRTNDRPAASTASSNKSVHALRSGNLTRLLGSSELSVLWCPVDRTSGVWLIVLQLFGLHVLVVAPRTEQGIAVRLEVSYGLPGAGGGRGLSWLITRQLGCGQGCVARCVSRRHRWASGCLFEVSRCHCLQGNHIWLLRPQNHFVDPWKVYRNGQISHLCLDFL